MSQTARIAFPLYVRLDSLPTTVEMIPPVAAPIRAFGMVMLLGFIPFMAMALAFADGHPWSAAFFLGLAVLPVWLGIAVRRRAGQSLTVTFTEEGVSVVDGRRGFADTWTAPYAAFRGVRLRTETIPQSVGNIAADVIELEHSMPDRTLPLAVRPQTQQGRTVADIYARLVGLPLLD